MEGSAKTMKMKYLVKVDTQKIFAPKIGISEIPTIKGVSDILSYNSLELYTQIATERNNKRTR